MEAERVGAIFAAIPRHPLAPLGCGLGQRTTFQTMIENSNPDGGLHGDTDQAETEMHPQEIAFPGAVARRAVTYKPTRDIILLQWEPQSAVGGIIIPDKAKQVMKLSFHSIPVIAVGPDCKTVKAGDNVLLPEEAILTVKYDGRVAYFCNEMKVLAVISEQA